MNNEGPYKVYEDARWKRGFSVTDSDRGGSSTGVWWTDRAGAEKGREAANIAYHQGVFVGGEIVRLERVALRAAHDRIASMEKSERVHMAEINAAREWAGRISRADGSDQFTAGKQDAALTILRAMDAAIIRELETKP